MLSVGYRYLADTALDNVACNVIVLDLVALVRDDKEEVEPRHDGIAHLDIVLGRFKRGQYTVSTSVRALVACRAVSKAS